MRAAVKFPRKKRLLVLSGAALLVLLTMVLWFFLLPKRPFAFLKPEDVQQVELLYTWVGVSDKGKQAIKSEFREIVPEDREVFVQAMKNLTVTRWASREERVGTVGAVIPAIITMRNGDTYAFDATGAVMRLTKTDHKKTTYYRHALGFWIADDEASRQAVSTFMELRMYYNHAFSEESEE